MRFLEEWWGGLPHAVFQHPLTKAGRPLDFRVLAQGEPDQPALLVTAGLHGVEGIAGLQLLTQWAMSRGLRDARDSGVTIVVVPTINLFGASRLRRVDEDGVDLNRNFVSDWAAALPTNAGYSELHSALVPCNWEKTTREEADARIREFIATRGFEAYKDALTGGQYAHSDGLFYGGIKPSWSNLTLRRVLRMWLSKATRVVHIDIHTGLGPFGVGEMLCPAYDGDLMLERAAQIWESEVKSPFKGESVSSAVSGHMAGGLIRLFPRAEITSIAIEFGTHPIERVIDAMRAEAVWNNMGCPDGADGEAIRREMLECFCPADPDWFRSCYEQFNQRMRQAIRALQT